MNNFRSHNLNFTRGVNSHFLTLNFIYYFLSKIYITEVLLSFRGGNMFEVRKVEDGIAMTVNKSTIDALQQLLERS